MKNWIKKHPIFVTCALLLFTPAALNYSGFCMAEGRWLSDEEIAYKYLQGGGTTLKPTKEAILDYIRHSPYCCVVNMRHINDFESFFSRSIGFNSKGLYVQYETQRPIRKKERYIEDYISMDNCGNAKEHLSENLEKMHVIKKGETK